MTNRNPLRRLLVLVAFCTGFSPSWAAPASPVGIDALPFPWAIAHRGGRLLWPEHTMVAYQASVDAGNQFVEVDCIAMPDGSVIVMHDGELERTTTGKGSVTALSARGLANIRVDGRRLLGLPWQQYPVPYFDEVLTRFGNKKIIVAEAKNVLAGAAIVAKLKQYRIRPEYVIVNSFYPEALGKARSAGYKTCLNLKNEKLETAKIAKIKDWAVSCYTSVTEAEVRALKNAGKVVLIYTPENHFQRDEALAKGADGYYCDDPVYMAFDTGYWRNSDPFGKQTWSAGMLEAQPGGRGRFTAPDKWGIDASSENVYRGCLQGWLYPNDAANWTAEVAVTFGVGLTEGRWASLAMLTTDEPLESDVPRGRHYGYNFLFYNDGAISIFKYQGDAGKSPTLLGVTPSKSVEVGVTRNYRITVTPSHLKMECLNNGNALEFAENAYRGRYVTLGAKGQKADFSNISIKSR